MNKVPSYTNGKIDLYSLQEHDDEVIYKITLHNSLDSIGNISIFTKSFYSDYDIGNVTYGIDKEYRGNHYSLQSLELLQDKFLEMGLFKPLFKVIKSNVASIKTIESFGGVRIDEEENMYAYQVDMLDKIENERRM